MGARTLRPPARSRKIIRTSELAGDLSLALAAGETHPARTQFILRALRGADPGPVGPLRRAVATRPHPGPTGSRDQPILDALEPDGLAAAGAGSAALPGANLPPFAKTPPPPRRPPPPRA